MNERIQQIETLIKLVELNEDDTWLETFRVLRTGGYLPGGGAGSLNDWGPYYSGEFENVWYGKLYEILRYLFDDNLHATRIESFKAIKFRNNFRIIRCLACNGSYQHPSSFESHIALDFYERYLPQFTANVQLTNILIPRKSFESDAAIEYRNCLKDHYAAKSIKIYDFVSAKYICPHCGKNDNKTVHDLYQISDRNCFNLAKQGAIWEDFEK